MRRSTNTYNHVESVSELNPKLLQYYLSFIVRLISPSIHPSLLHHLELAFRSKSCWV